MINVYHNNHSQRYRCQDAHGFVVQWVSATKTINRIDYYSQHLIELIEHLNRTASQGVF